MSLTALPAAATSSGRRVLTALSFGGGLNSVALLLRLVLEGWPLDVVVFADTRHESQATYRVVRFAKAWCERRGIAFVWVHSSRFDRLEQKWREGEARPMAATVAVNGGTQAGMMDVYHSTGGTPSVQTHSCSVEYKRDVVYAYYQSIGAGEDVEVRQFIGFAVNERSRMDRAESPAKLAQRPAWLRQEYPLITTWQMDRHACGAYIREHGADWPPVTKSGCDGCPFAGQRSMLHFARSTPLEFRRWLEAEERLYEVRGQLYPWGIFRARAAGPSNAIVGPRLREIDAASRQQVGLDQFQAEDEGACLEAYCNT